MSNSPLTPPPNAWTEAFSIREHELDADGRLAVVAVCARLQDAASRHANELGFSVEALSRTGITWVLSRLRLEFGDRPGKDAPLLAATWPSGVSGLFATRDYVLAPPGGAPVVRATTAWLMVDVHRRRPVRLTDEVLALSRGVTTRALTDDFQKMAPFGSSVPDRRVRSGWSDLDVNRHVNHVRIVAWLLDAVPTDIRSGNELARFDLHFRTEVTADRDLLIRTATAGPDSDRSVRQDLVDELTGSVCAEARGDWRRRD